MIKGSKTTVMHLEAYILTSSVVSISVCLRVIVQNFFPGNAKTLHKTSEYYLSSGLYPVGLLERDILTVSRTHSNI